MPKPFTRTQTLENRAFLTVLRRTGNVRLACREVGLKYGTMQHRRRKHPGFAARWDAALVFAQAGLEARAAREGRPGSKSRDVSRVALCAHAGRPTPSLPAAQAARAAPASLHSVARTQGGEPHLVRLRNGKLQLQRAQVGKLTPAAEQAFLAALSVTCNVSLAAAAVGSCFNAFNRRRRKDPAFAREMRLALARGYEALEAALLESSLPGAHEHDEWRSNDPPAIPPTSANQALQLMYLHQKAVLQLDEPDYVRRRRGESREAHSERLALMAEERDRRAREEYEAAEAERRDRGEPPLGPAGEERFGLPDLAQVTGWSRADPAKGTHDPSRALFGGWRIEDMEEALARRRATGVNPATASDGFSSL